MKLEIVLLFFSEIALEVMQIAKDWHLDRTSKTVLIFFSSYHSVIMQHTSPCVFLFLQKKTKQNYNEALSHVRKVSIENNKQLKPVLYFDRF